MDKAYACFFPFNSSIANAREYFGQVGLLKT